MNLKQKLAALQAEAAELRKKSADDLTEADVERIPALKAEIDDTQKKIKAQEDAAASLKSAVEEEDQHAQDADEPAARKARGDRPTTLGDAFVGSAALKAFREQNPSGPSKDTPISITARAVASKGQSVRAIKAPLNTIDNGDTTPTRLPGIEDVTYRKPNTLLDLITVGVTNAQWLEYRQLISVTNNAAIVPEAQANNVAANLKPISDLATTTADAKAHTYADGIEATQQELNDDGALASLINGILTQNLRDEIERVVLLGDDANGEPNGILNTTGVLQQAFNTDMVTSVRKGKTLLRETSNTIPQAIVLNPEDDEAFDLLKDANERFYGNGPFGTGPQSIWAVPRVTSASIPQGQALMGDFRAFQLLIFEALSILAFNQHKDYAQRNLVYVRAELRALQLFRQPAKLAVIELESAA
ncbi:phage major capsid protein [Microbacterium luteum]|uniref:phage major capsid protein n=1 Tax=Microbacterium luteum TaxID=2782167 RepID=UPI001888FB5B|nr:phage major capsid protein [Microbacterium luteum]